MAIADPDEAHRLTVRAAGGADAAGRRAIVFGHWDADGYLAAEQSRVNLAAFGAAVDKVVVSLDTRNYSFWEQAFSRACFHDYGLVVIVDIAFDFLRPEKSLDAVLSVVRQHPTTDFAIIDHHPFLHPVRGAANLQMVDVESVYSCCWGEPSDELMVLAALCQGEKRFVKRRITPSVERRALGFRRAVAALKDSSGSALMRLLADREWELFEKLADEPAALHRNVRGRRVSGTPSSPALVEIMRDQQPGSTSLLGT